jgi:hypothetical protein
VKRTQVLASGLAIRQDYSQAIRAVFFETDHEEFIYATNGGTAFIVNFRGRPTQRPVAMSYRVSTWDGCS